MGCENKAAQLGHLFSLDKVSVLLHAFLDLRMGLALDQLAPVRELGVDGGQEGNQSDSGLLLLLS